MKFKRYDQNQSYLLPPTLSECLPEDHISFVINEVVDHLDMSAIENEYVEEGHPAYHPKMMIKILFYGYTQGVRSSRKLESKTCEDIAFRFLTANTHLDHGTINLFRKTHLLKLPLVFTQIIAVARGLGLADFSDISIDGTKIKAQASRSNLFTKERIMQYKAKIESFLEEAEKIDKEEDAKFGSNRGYNQIPKRLADPKTRRKEIEKLQKKLAKLDKADKEIDRKQKEAKENDKSPRRRCHKEQDKMVNKTSNTTDPESALMKMKDSSYKMAFNVGFTAANQFIAGYDVSDESTDTYTLEEMVQKTESLTKEKIKIAKADAAYFTKENITFLKGKKIEPFIPDHLDENENKEKQKELSKYDRRNFVYNQENDQVICPEGKILKLKQKSLFSSKGTKIYEGTECESCPNRHLCTKGKVRSIHIDFQLKEMREEMRKRLSTMEGRAKYDERKIEVEPVIGNLKHNQNFTEFLCRGKTMACVEVGLASSAHNLTKIFLALKEKGIKWKEVPWDKILTKQTA